MRPDRDPGSPLRPAGSGHDFAGNWRISGYGSSFAVRCCGSSRLRSSNCASPLGSGRGCDCCFYFFGSVESTTK